MVRAATARVRHGRIDIGVGRTGAPLQQGERAHDHSGLAVAALRRVEFFPGELDRMAAIGREPSMVVIFLPTAVFAATLQDQLAGHRHAPCSAALSDAAAELGAVRPTCSRITHSNGVTGSASMVFPFHSRSDRTPYLASFGSRM